MSDLLSSALLSVDNPADRIACDYPVKGSSILEVYATCLVTLSSYHFCFQLVSEEQLL